MYVHMSTSSSKCTQPSPRRKVGAPHCYNKAVSACWEQVCLLLCLTFITLITLDKGKKTPFSHWGSNTGLDKLSTNCVKLILGKRNTCLLTPVRKTHERPKSNLVDQWVLIEITYRNMDRIAYRSEMAKMQEHCCETHLDTDDGSQKLHPWVYMRQKSSRSERLLLDTQRAWV